VSAERKLPKGHVLIVGRVSAYEERATLWAGGMNWSRASVHTLYGECGHSEERRGDAFPKRSFLCRKCARGRARVAPGFIGVLDKRNGAKVENPVAAAFIADVLTPGAKS